MPSAAAERKIAPIFVGFITFSRTAMRTAFFRMSAGSEGFGLRIAQSMPRVRWNPVSCVRTSNSAA